MPFTLLPRWRRGSDGDIASIIETATGLQVPLPDCAAWSDSARLTLLGRKDMAVQVGGINVFPAQVAGRLATHPLVAEAVVRLDAELPEPRLRAFVTLRAGGPAAPALRELEAWCRSTMAAAERPVRIDIGRTLPRNALGKSADWRPSPVVTETGRAARRNLRPRRPVQAVRPTAP
jgi:acyl-coenzyme A synthetase/AMP-(fatty) acid ligase